jgi:6-phosphogluconolactonase (cycloisomerase 2 family)
MGVYKLTQGITRRGFLTAADSGRFVLVANYRGGSVAVRPVRRDGRLGEATDAEQFKGSGPNRERREAPHAHCILLEPRHDSLAAFRIDHGTGRLILLGHTPTEGKTRRIFVIDPTRSFLLAANQNSDSIVTFRIDAQTGALRPTGHKAEIPAPVCLKLTTPF